MMRYTWVLVHRCAGLAIALFFATEHFLDSVNEVTLSGYVRLDAVLAYHPKHLDVQLNVFNLADTDGASPSATARASGARITCTSPPGRMVRPMACSAACTTSTSEVVTSHGCGQFADRRGCGIQPS